MVIQFIKEEQRDELITLLFSPARTSSQEIPTSLIILWRLLSLCSISHQKSSESSAPRSYEARAPVIPPQHQAQLFLWISNTCLMQANLLQIERQYIQIPQFEQQFERAEAQAKAKIVLKQFQESNFWKQDMSCSKDEMRLGAGGEGEWKTLDLKWVMNNNLYYIILMQGEVVKRSVNQGENMETSCQKRKRRKIVNSESSQNERQLYFPDLYEYKKLQLDYEQRRVAHGGWTLEENKIYLQFLQKYSKDFGSEEQRRKTIVFNRLSKKLHKRTPDQCRSHHQKLQNRFKNNIEEIITFVKGKIKRKQCSSFEKEDMKLTVPTDTTKTSEVKTGEEGIVIQFDNLLDW